VMRAAYQGRMSILQLLLDHVDTHLTLTVPSGETILHLVIGYRRKKYHTDDLHQDTLDPTPVALLLLERSEVQEIAHMPDYDGWTSLMRAAQFGCDKVIDALLAVPGVDVHATAVGGKTAMGLAVEGGHHFIVEKLRVAGVN